MICYISTVQIREEICYSLESRKLFTEEQKGSFKRSRGTIELIFVDQHILKGEKKKAKICSHDINEKVYDRIPKIGII